MTEGDVDQLARISFKRFLVHLVDEFGEMKMPLTASRCEILKALKLKVRGVEFLTLGVPNMEIAELIGSHPSTRRIHSRAGNIEIAERTVGAAVTAEMIRQRNTGTTLVCREDRMLSNVLLPNGDVQFCSMDYGLSHSLGSLAKSSYSEVVGGPEYHAVFQALASPDSDILCRRCEYAFPGKYHAVK
jgi:hypothetical protein